MHIAFILKFQFLPLIANLNLFSVLKHEIKNQIKNFAFSYYCNYQYCDNH